MFLPATHTEPASGTSLLFTSRKRVDFPEPDGPTRNTNSPLPTSNVTSFRATTSELYFLVTLSSLIIRVPGIRETEGRSRHAFVTVPRARCPTGSPPGGAIHQVFTRILHPPEAAA